MLDFNDAPGGKARKAPEDGATAAREKDEIRAALNDQLPLLALDIWPSGKRRQNKYLVGDVMGARAIAWSCCFLDPRRACGQTVPRMRAEITDCP